MARMVSTDMVAYVRRACGNPTSDELADFDILRVMNNIQEDLTLKYDFSELRDYFDFTTVAGQQVYSLVTLNVTNLCTYIEGLVVQPWQRIKEISNYKFRKLNGLNNAYRGVPYFYNRSSFSEFMLYPVPSGAYPCQMWYSRNPTELVLTPASEVASPDLHAVWDSIITDKAVVRCMADLEKLDIAANYQKLVNIDQREKDAWQNTREQNIPRSTTVSRMGQVLNARR